ncbi:MAG TPA: acetyl-CoA carboxylase biotin carboxyl carrier protein [Terracidiphilus sp.]|jgi:acetyl-CoA carboxylase biotin carboxyl carrier protein
MKQEDIQDLQQLIEFLKEHGVAEFDLEREDVKVRLKFAQPIAPVVAFSSSAAPIAAPQLAPVAATAPVATPVAAVAAAAPAAEENLHIIKSPIVGTYYGSPSPGAPSFVSIGERVEKGQVICIVEAMKLMNEIEADAAGEIVKILVTNGQPVEYGQPLFSIRTA